MMHQRAKDQGPKTAIAQERRIGGPVSLLLALVCLVTSCGPAPPPEAPLPGVPGWPNTRPGVAYVGDAACADCHEDAYQGFQDHGMARSVALVTPKTAPALLPGLEQGPVSRYHAPSDFTYRVYADDGRYYQEELRHDSLGQVLHRQVREITFTIGSGTAGFAYLSAHDGRYTALPMAYYSQAERWDLSPGYEAHNLRFDRVIGDRCLFCHAAYPNPIPPQGTPLATPPLPIGCERCHGPGALHVAARLAAPAPPPLPDTTIVNPRHLALDRRLDVCGQCHLNGAVAVLRAGREVFDYRPGEPLAAHQALYETTIATPGVIGIVSHAERLQESACFRETLALGTPLECVSCHDPHAGFRAAGPAYFDQTCQGCHAPAALTATFAVPGQPAPLRAAHAGEASCVGCHMPKSGLDGAPHTSFTDHHIRVVRDTVRLAPPTGPGAVTLTPRYARDAAGPEAALYAALADLSFGLSRGDEELLRRGVAAAAMPLAQHPGFAEGHRLYGEALRLLGQPAEAAEAFAAAAQASDDPTLLLAQAQARTAAGVPAAPTEALYQQVLAQRPEQAEAWVGWADFLVGQGRFEEADAAYTTALVLRPSMQAALLGQGRLRLQGGALGAARQRFEQVLALDPDDPEARVNLGITWAAQGQAAPAAAHYQAVLKRHPDHVPALYNLAVLRLRRQPAEAAALLERALAAAPTYTNARLNLGLAYLQLGRRAEARAAAEAVLQADPDNPQARQLQAATQ